jgi:hypothetical protein
LPFWPFAVLATTANCTSLVALGKIVGKKLSVYVDLGGLEIKSFRLRNILRFFGCEVAPENLDLKEYRVDVIITGPEKAPKLMEDAEKAWIYIFCFNKSSLEEAQVFAMHYPEQVQAILASNLVDVTRKIFEKD